jgi:hypothetical protein
VTDTQISIGIPDDRGLVPAHLSVEDGSTMPAGPHIAGVPEVFEGSTGKQGSVLVSVDGPRSRIDVRLEGGAQGARLSVEGLPHVAVSRTGHRVALGYETHIAFHDGRTGDLLDTMQTGSLRRPFITVADQLFLASRSGELTRYDLDTLQPIRSYGASQGVALSVHGTLDGSLIAVQGGDRSVTLHDVETGVALGGPLLIADTETVRLISLSIDGTTLAYGGGLTTGAKVWDLRPERWRAAACEVAGRNLTRAEWESHIGDLAPYRATCDQFPLDPRPRHPSGVVDSAS